MALVVLYHAGVTQIPGGFIGVDVFFVISGFLITRIIDADLRAGSFSITKFYLRRARRILPALLVVSGVTLLLALFLFLPAELAALGRELIAVAAFSSNLLFWNDAGYFDKGAELKPFLHVWSLAIEEQFYLLWPLALAASAKGGIDARRLTWTTVAVSLAVSCWWAVRDPPAAFFLLPSRAWELLGGALLALRSRRLSLAAWQLHVMSCVGLLLIILAAVFLDRHSHFPGWNALMLCLGAICLIASGEAALCNRLLCSPLLVFVGLISYSLYLWHWPLLALARTVNLGEITGKSHTTVLIALLLSILSWRFVERPFRWQTVRAAPTVPLLRYGCALGVLAVAGGAAYSMRGFPQRVPLSVVEAQAAQGDVNPSRSLCQFGRCSREADRPAMPRKPEVSKQTNVRHLGRLARRRGYAWSSSAFGS